MNRSLRILPTPSALGFPLNIYVSVCIYRNTYIHIHTHTQRFKQKGKKDEKPLHKTLKPKQNLHWSETNSQNWTYFTMFFCSPRARSFQISSKSTFHLTIHLDTFQCWAMEAGKVYPYNSRLVCKFQSREHCQIERTWSWSFSYTLNAWRKPESRE